MSDETSIAQAMVEIAEASTEVRRFLIRKRIQAMVAGVLGPHQEHHPVAPMGPVQRRATATPDLQEPDVVDLMERGEEP